MKRYFYISSLLLSLVLPVAANAADADQVNDFLNLNAVAAMDQLPDALAQIQPDQAPCQNTASSRAPVRIADRAPAYILYSEGDRPSVHVLVGGSASDGQTPYAYQVVYETPISKHNAIGVDYINYGHTQDHDDGYAIEFIRRWAAKHGKVEFEVGAGGEITFNTEPRGTSSTDVHGAAAVGHAAVIYNVSKNGFLEARVDETVTGVPYKSTSFLVGGGVYLARPESDYRFESDGSSGTQAYSKNDYFIATGRSIVNDLHSETGQALQAGYKRDIWGPFGVTVSYLNSGDSDKSQSQGVAIEPTATAYLGSRGQIEASVAAGPDFEKYVGSSGIGTGTMISFDLGYRFENGFGVHFNPNREFIANDPAKSHFDKDVIMVRFDYKPKLHD
jgi:hypothetical protein